MDPISGLWQPSQLKALYYGPDTVAQHLLSSLPSEHSRAFLVTGNSLATKTPLIKQVEQILGSRHAGTFSKIGEHAPVAQLDEAAELAKQDGTIDTIISIGGGSPIDSAKAVSYRVKEKTGTPLFHITIPTTLSAAECTFGAGFTSKDGQKTGFGYPEMAPQVILYDGTFVLATPPHLFLSTGLRALDHAMELMYMPTASELARLMCLQAASNLFIFLPKYKDNPKDLAVITQLQLAAFGSLGMLGLNFKGPLGLSHVLGYALGAPYKIPHGVTSCLTLGHVVKLKADTDHAAAQQIARMAPFIGLARSGDDKDDARLVGESILALVDNLGLKTTLTERGVGRDQIDIIVQRATGAKEGEPIYVAVKRLVEGLF